MKKHIERLKVKTHDFLRWTEQYTKTDMVYLATSSFWINLNNVIVTIFSFILSMAFARLLSKEAYGTYQFILSIASIFSAITLTGMNNAITQAVARGFEGSFKKSIMVQLTWGIIPLLFGILVAIYYVINGNIALAISIFIAAILIPISNSFNTYSAFIGGKKDFKRAFFYGQILNFSYYPIMVGSLFITHNPIYLVLINLLINSTVTIFLYLFTVHFYNPNNKEDLATIPFGKHMSLANILGTAVLQFDNMLVYHFVGAAPLAIYTFATNIPDRFNGLFKSVATAALPKFSIKSHEELKKVIIPKSIRFAFFTLCGSTIYIVFAPFFYHIFFPQYELSVLYSQAYSLMLAIAALSSMPINVLLATKAHKEIYIYSILNPMVSIGLMFFGAIAYGIWGLIFAKGISAIFSFILLLILILKTKGRKLETQTKNTP